MSVRLYPAKNPFSGLETRERMLRRWIFGWYETILRSLKFFSFQLGLNADIRYHILGRADGDSHKFSIDPLTGQVRSVTSFIRDAGKIYGFDVKATDRRGADIGRSAIANVFVSASFLSQFQKICGVTPPVNHTPSLEKVCCRFGKATNMFTVPNSFMSYKVDLYTRVQSVSKSIQRNIRWDRYLPTYI